MNTLRQAAQQALEKSEPGRCMAHGECFGGQCIYQSQPEQEPVGEVLNERGEIDYISYVPPVGTRLYTTPPAAQQRKPLAKVEIEKILSTHYMYTEDLIRAVEAAHGIKENT